MNKNEKGKTDEMVTQEEKVLIKNLWKKHYCIHGQYHSKGVNIESKKFNPRSAYKKYSTPRFHDKNNATICHDLFKVHGETYINYYLTNTGKDFCLEYFGLYHDYMKMDSFNEFETFLNSDILNSTEPLKHYLINLKGVVLEINNKGKVFVKDLAINSGSISNNRLRKIKKKFKVINKISTLYGFLVKYSIHLYQYVDEDWDEIFNVFEFEDSI